MTENDTNIWQTPAFRNQIVGKIEGEITKLGVSSFKSSQQLENENYEKASSKEEYLKLIALLITFIRQKSKEQSVNFSPEKLDATSSKLKPDSRDWNRKNIRKTTTKRRKLKNEELLTCAVCCSSFPSKVSLRNHIKTTRHVMKEALPSSVIDTLPQQWLFTVVNYFKKTNGYKMEICLPAISSVELTQEWMSEFMKYNQCDYAWERDCVDENKTQHEVVYCCQYGEKRSKSTCKSKISFILKKGRLSYATAMIDFDHDHTIPFNEDPRQCNPSAEVKEMLFKYFESAANAIEAFRNTQIHIETQLETEDEYLECMSDRSKIPVLSWVRNVYNTKYQNKKPTNLNREQIDLLRKFINDKNEEQNEPICQFQELPNNNFVIFIVTACMKRALKSQAASELVYTDNIGSAGQFGLRVYLLLTNIKGEVVPLAVMITSSEMNKAIKTGFGLLSMFLDDQSFNSKGRLGPAIIQTDDSIAEMISIKGLFPYSKIVLSVFHFLKTCYKWLIKTEHKINKQNRDLIYVCIRQMVYAENETVLKTLFDNLVEVYKNHELVSSYICKLYEKRQTWALCYRRNFLTMDESDHDTWKRTLTTLKEQILSKIKLQEPKLLLSYFLNEFSEFYQRRLIDCALNRYTSERHLFENRFQDYLFVRNDHCESLFTMQNRTTNVKYQIITDINICTCYVGCSGISCEHQKILEAYYEDDSRTDSNDNDTKTKLELYYIVSGCKDVPEEFFGLSNQISDDLQFGGHIKPMFDDVQMETVIDDSISQHDSVQQGNNLYEKFAHEIEIDPSTHDTNSSQVYPIIISHNDNESIVTIENSASDENKQVETAPGVLYSISFTDETVNNNVMEILPIDIQNNQYIGEIITDTVIKEEKSFEEESHDDAMKQELIKFNQHFASFREMIKKNPQFYEAGLLHLNNQLDKLKNDPDALFRAINTYKIKM